MGTPSPLRAQFQSLGRFLYTQNPFYLISCGFVMYGLQVAAASLSDQYSRASFLTSSLSLYTVLMAVTAVAVIRWGRIWEDARSILLIIMIGQAAYSIAVDELCLNDRHQAGQLLLAGAIGTYVITELVLWCCRIRFAFWYRSAYYALMSVFYAAPYLASHFRVGNSEVANWSPLLFSLAAAAAILLLIPAVRGGQQMAKENGTPWKWPLFPLSAFVILAVLAGFRSHAIWISFGSLLGNVSFEPLLLMPLLLAALTLAMEDALVRGKIERAQSLLYSSPMFLVCGVNSFSANTFKKQYYSFDSGLEVWGGSTMTVAFVLLILFVIYAGFHRVKGALQLMATFLFALAIIGHEPTALLGLGFEQWMIAIPACVIWLGLCQKQDATEWRWLGLILQVGTTIVLAGNARSQLPLAMAIAAVWSVLMLLFIGWSFDTVFAYKIRRAVAYLLIVGGIIATAYHFVAAPVDAIAPTFLAAAIISLGYAIAVRRSGWFSIATGFALGAFMTSTLFTPDTLILTSAASHHWQLKTGLLCFCVGVLITSSKTGTYQRVRDGLRSANMQRGFVRGF
ncbi:MAG: hypothetical protein WBD20_26430 [Pirellulaceae bacterium]